MARWRRPYSLDTAIALPLFRLGFAVAMGTLFGLAYTRGEISTPDAIPIAAAFGVLVAISVRRAMIGVYVSEVGIRSRGYLHTVTVPWESISRIRSTTATIPGKDMGRPAITIERTDGTAIQTPLLRGDAHRPYQSFTFAFEFGKLTVPPDRYDEILAALRGHQDAKRKQPT